MKRREFITLLGGAAAWPLGARAQQPAIPVVGFLISGTPEANIELVAAFRRGMSEIGFVEGRNVAVEYRWSYDDTARMPELAADLVQRRVAVIAGSTARAALAAKAATASIPIVFWAAADAVQLGLVSNLGRPDGNLTGINSMSAELGAKRLGLLGQLVPQALRFGVLAQPNVPASESRIAAAQAAATTMGRPIDVLAASSAREIDAAFAHAVEKKVDALMVIPGQLFDNRRVQLTTLTLRHVVPTIFPERSFTEIGGLMSYGSSRADEYRLVGIYVGRILKGEKLTDLPVLQPTKFEFIINLQTARTLGITVPSGLLAAADEVIE
jgi:putative tryptophan/tyrosine transport system substrate-binding protein